MLVLGYSIMKGLKKNGDCRHANMDLKTLESDSKGHFLRGIARFEPSQRTFDFDPENLVHVTPVNFFQFWTGQKISRMVSNLWYLIRGVESIALGPKAPRGFLSRETVKKRVSFALSKKCGDLVLFADRATRRFFRLENGTQEPFSR